MQSILDYALASQKPHKVTGVNGHSWQSRWYKHPFLDAHGRIRHNLPKIRTTAKPEVLSDGQTYLLITAPE